MADFHNAKPLVKCENMDIKDPIKLDAIWVRNESPMNRLNLNQRQIICMMLCTIIKFASSVSLFVHSDGGIHGTYFVILSLLENTFLYRFLNLAGMDVLKWVSESDGRTLGENLQFPCIRVKTYMQVSYSTCAISWRHIGLRCLAV